MDAPAETRVLVVDDDAMIRRMIIAMLTRLDLLVVGSAVDGRAALDAALLLDPDIVLMDYHMPVMDGLTATQLLKQLPHAPKIVIFTSEDLPSLQPAASAAGADALLQKGCSLAMLQQTLARLAPAARRIGGYAA